MFTKYQNVAPESLTFGASLILFFLKSRENRARGAPGEAKIGPKGAPAEVVKNRSQNNGTFQANQDLKVWRICVWTSSGVFLTLPIRVNELPASTGASFSRFVHLAFL